MKDSKASKLGRDWTHVIIRAGRFLFGSKLGVRPVRPDGEDGGHVVSSQSLRRDEVKSACPSGGPVKT